MSRLCLFLTALALLASPATAQSSSQGVAEMPGRPVWTTPPAAEASDYPALALLLGIEATIRLRCRARPDGRVTDCGPVDPPGDLGFERSAVAIIERGRVQPHVVNGAPVEAVFTVSVPFAVPGEEDVQRYQGPEPSERTLAMVGDRMIYGRGGDEGLWWSFPMDDLSIRERAVVGPILRDAFGDYRRAWWEGIVLGMARRSSEDIEIAIDRGRHHDDIPASDGVDDPVYDQLNLVEIGIRDRARAIYCARYACPPQT